MEEKTNTDQMRVFFRGGPKNGEMQIFYKTETDLFFDSISHLAIEPMESRYQPMQDMGLLMIGESAGIQWTRHHYQMTHDNGRFRIFTYKGCTTK
jgi:hypothetical protein